MWDTDAFGIFEFRRLYPALFCEIYYQGRHSEQEGTKYRFDLMEVDAGGDWRLGDEHLLRTAFVYSRYSGSMNFIEQGQKIKFGYTYHIGSSFQLRWTHESVLPSLEMDIAPRGGRRITFQYDRASQRFLDGFEIHQTYGTLVETYRKYNYDQIHMDWRST